MNRVVPTFSFLIGDSSNFIVGGDTLHYQGQVGRLATLACHLVGSLRSRPLAFGSKGFNLGLRQ